MTHDTANLQVFWQLHRGLSLAARAELLFYATQSSKILDNYHSSSYSFIVIIIIIIFFNELLTKRSSEHIKYKYKIE